MSTRKARQPAPTPDFNRAAADRAETLPDWARGLPAEFSSDFAAAIRERKEAEAAMAPFLPTREELWERRREALERGDQEAAEAAWHEIRVGRFARTRGGPKPRTGRKHSTARRADRARKAYAEALAAGRVEEAKRLEGKAWAAVSDLETRGRKSRRENVEFRNRLGDPQLPVPAEVKPWTRKYRRRRRKPTARQLALPILDQVPAIVRRHGLQEAARRPLVSPGKRRDGTFPKSWRTSTWAAWRNFPSIQVNPGNCWAALIFDLDGPEAIDRALGDHRPTRDRKRSYGLVPGRSGAPRREGAGGTAEAPGQNLGVLPCRPRGRSGLSSGPNP